MGWEVDSLGGEESTMHGLGTVPVKLAGKDATWPEG